MDFKNLASFDATMDTYENGGEKAEKRLLAKTEKESSMRTKVGELKTKVIRKKQELNKSVMDPRMDTVQIALDLAVLEKEYQVAKDIYAAVFPEEAATV